MKTSRAMLVGALITGLFACTNNEKGQFENAARDLNPKTVALRASVGRMRAARGGAANSPPLMEVCAELVPQLEAYGPPKPNPENSAERLTSDVHMRAQTLATELKACTRASFPKLGTEALECAAKCVRGIDGMETSLTTMREKAAAQSVVIEPLNP